jgi:hypothetical protein
VPDLSIAELVQVTPLLLESGAAALAWCSVRNSHLKATPAANELQQAYRLHAIQAALHEINIKEVLTLFRAAGIESLLVKGWAIARLYSEPGTRAYGDIDLCVRPSDYSAARDVLSASGDRYPVDLHQGMDLLDDREWDELFARSQVVPLDDVTVRILSEEDHFRVLCFHLLRHGVERASGLCDIAVALESRPHNFDWHVCLGKDRTHANWIICTIALARQLLGAETGDLPFELGQERDHRRLVRCVLKSWARPFSEHFTRQKSMSFYLNHPSGLMQALTARWPSPIVGTVGSGGAFNKLPRFPYQLNYLLIRSGRFLRELASAESKPSRFFSH